MITLSNILNSIRTNTNTIFSKTNIDSMSNDQIMAMLESGKKEDDLLDDEFGEKAVSESVIFYRITLSCTLFQIEEDAKKANCNYPDDCYG